ncbi:MAG: hypothetical protein IJR52_11030 [Selenomonadaceae bacterium]|nr:hypothetical protein [Selenomonadaceae bacterium]
MADIIFGILFVVIFYFVFKAIWTNVTTVSYNGLEGFFKSWGNQIFWAFIITAIIVTIIAKILESVLNFGRGLNFGFGDLLIWGFVAYIVYAIFASGDAFDRKTFRENYNRHVVELNKKLNLEDTVLFHISHENPGNLIDLNDTREVNELTLAEDFVSEGSSKLVQFPNMSINHYVNKSGNYKSIKLSLSPSTCEDIEGKAALSYIRRLIAEITFTAAIEAVAEGKSRAIENSLHLINEHGVFGLLEYVSDEKISRDYTEDGIKYLVSREGDGNIYLKMIKTSSEDK